ncbi:DUF4091 domain-containing protein [Paenibacillus dendritiformis]|uniref:DUF4091 domain-containing protein n=1 Tax=Paenibacillus dendritiformis TaxID=130049 RepID=UPI0036573A5D
MKYEVYSANEWLYPDSEIANPYAHSVSLASARGSYASCQILFNGVPANASIAWTFQPRGERRLPGSVEVYQLLDVQVNENTDVDVSTIPAGSPAPPYVTRQAPFRVYDALRPVKDRYTARAATEAAYLCWPIPVSADPGLYEGELMFEIGGERGVIPVRIEVFPAAVPGRGRLAVTNWYSVRNIADRHGLEMWSEPYWEMLYRYGAAMRRGRQTHFMVGAPFIEIHPQGGGRYSFDFSKAERLITMFLELGFTHIEGGHIAGRTHWEAPRFMLNADRTIPATSPEGYAFLSQFVPAWRDWLRSKGWLDRLVQHIADEPIAPSADDYRILSGIVRKWMPGVPLIDAVIHTGVAGAVDIWVPTNKDYELNRDAYEAYRQSGDALWFYTCWNPGGEYLNRFLDFPLLKTRYLHWGNYLYGLDGYLHWGFNYYFADQDPMELTNPLLAPDVHDRRVPAGDTHIVYPGDGGPMLSMRLEAMRAGVEDYELLSILAEHDRPLADSILASCMGSFRQVNTDPAHFEAAHRRLLEAASAYCRST